MWPGIVVSEENLKHQVSVLRKALGTNRDLIHTEIGRGYRFTGVLRAGTATDPCRGATRSTGEPSESGAPAYRRGRRAGPGWCR